MRRCVARYKSREVFSDMADFSIENGRVTYEHNGRTASFANTQLGHMLSDEEVTALLDGESIEFEAISKKGKPYQAVLRMQEYTYEDNDGNERHGFGPRLDFDEMNRRRGVPETWCKHLFTAAEKATLEHGGKVHLDDCTSRAGRDFACDVEFKEEVPGQGRRIVPDFGPRR